MRAEGDRNIGLTIGADGVLMARIDMPGRSMNVFSGELMDSLEALLDHVQSDNTVRAVVLYSGKTTFLAGADLEMVRTFTEKAQSDSAAELHRLCGRLGRLFLRLETSGKPFVAAIQGLALGGGLEVALACDAIVAAEQTEVGLPEIKLGLLPGAGGTQRLPRLIGRRKALELMLSGEPVSTAQALMLGIVDAVVPADVLLSAAVARARDLCVARSEDRPPVRNPVSAAARHGESSDAFDPEVILDELRISDQIRKNYPAYDAIVQCVVGGWSKSMDLACSWEMDCFVRLIQDPTAGNMIRSLFLDRQRAAKLSATLPKVQPRARVRGTRTLQVSSLLRAAGVEIDESDTFDGGCLTIDTDEVCQQTATKSQSVVVRWLHTQPDRDVHSPVAPAVWVSEPTAYGRAVEVIVDARGQGKTEGLLIARWLRAVPVISREHSLFARLLASKLASEGHSCEEGLRKMSDIAANHRAQDPEMDTSITDCAAVVAGLFPAYTGGPFTYLRQHGGAHGH